MKRSPILFWCLAAALALGVAAIYGQTWDFGLLSYDDEGYTSNCPFVRDGFSIANLIGAFRDPAWGGIWMPITNLTYMATITLFGTGSGAQHLVSVFFHAINAVLFFLLLLRLSTAKPLDPPTSKPLLLCFAAAALWAWHPLRVESVAWIASRKDTLFTMFSLLGLFAWMSGRLGWGYAAMALACMSKPSAMCFPFLALSVDLLTLRRKRVLAYVPLFVMAAATGALAMYSQTHGTGEAGHELFYSTFAWRLLNAAVSLGRYFYHLIIPEGLHFWYRPIRGGIPLHTPSALATLAVVSVAYLAALLKFPRARRVLLVSALWFLASIGPTLGVAGSFGNHALADRFTYVPMMAVSILAVALILRSRTFASRVPALVILFPISLVYAVPAFRYAATYRDNLTAFEQVARADPGHAYAWLNIGSETIERTRNYDLAISYFRKSRALFETPDVRDELVMALAARGNPADGPEMEELCADVIMDPSKDEKGFKLEALGMLAIAQHDWPRAIACLERALPKARTQEDCRMRLAMCYWNVRDYGKSVPHLLILARSSRPDISAKARQLLSAVPSAGPRKP